MRTLLCLLLATTMFAGCATEGSDTAIISVEAEGTSESYTVRFDASAPSLDLYTETGCERTAAFTAHDLILAWDMDVEMQYYDGGFGCGYTLCAVDGFPAAEMEGEALGCFERGGYWALFLNGSSAAVGISELEVDAHDELGLVWTTF